MVRIKIIQIHRPPPSSRLIVKRRNFSRRWLSLIVRMEAWLSLINKHQAIQFRFTSRRDAFNFRKILYARQWRGGLRVSHHVQLSRQGPLTLLVTHKGKGLIRPRA